MESVTEGVMEENESQNKLSWIDFVVIGIYFVLVLAVGLYSSYRSKRSSVKGYFLASRSMHWVPVGASLFASNIGSGHFIGLAGSGASIGIAIAAFELNAIFILMLLGWIFVPVYMSSGVYTMPEYLRLRFGGQRIRIYLACLALILYIFTKISADLYAGALFIQLALGIDGDAGLYGSILILLAIAALFTIAGGLTAVIWTDFVQTILMVIGSFVLMILSFKEVGGYDQLIEKFMVAEPSPEATRYDKNNVSCGAVKEDSMHLFRDISSPDLPWTGLIFGTTISSIWYWCSDQVIVQRALASKNMSHAKGGCLLAGYLKLLPLFLLIFPGMAARVLYTDRVACADPDYCFDVCGSTSGCSNIAYAELVMNLMPTGMAGMMLAVMMAALMSSLTSIFNSSSTIFTIDIWTRIRKNPSDTELLLVGRFSVLVLLVISILWVPVLKELRASQLFVYIQAVSNFLSPPVTAVFGLAFFYERTNEVGAFWGLMSGLVLGLIRFVLEFSYSAPACGSDEIDNRPEWIKYFVEDIHYLHYGCFLFIVTLAITYIISILTKPIDPEKLHRLTYFSRYSTEIRQPIDEEEEERMRKQEKEETNQPEEDEDEKEVGKCKTLFNCICGVDEKPKGNESDKDSLKLSPEEEAAQAVKILEEKTTWKRFVNFNAILLMTLAIFVYAYYA